MVPFDFQPRTRIVFGPGKLAQIGELAAQIGGRKALVVSDSGVVSAGHTERGIDSLEGAGLATDLFDAVHENPSTDDVDAGVEFARSCKPDLIVGLGGGSAMDCAKGINFLYTNGGRMEDYWGVGKASRPMLPMIAVPTTAGTGSESQSFALITDARTKAKMACGDVKASCRLALLDPELTLTQPPRITALTGVDALAHALETYVTTRRTAVSLAFSREAWHLLAGNIDRVLVAGDDLEARSGMQLGACFAGLAIENSMLGAAHALANPLTANYGIVHGEAIGMMLPHVVRFNGEKVPELYHDLLEATGGSKRHPRPELGVEGLATFVADIVGKAGLARRLSDRGVEENRLPELAEAAARQWTGKFNPRPVDPDCLLELYRCAF